MNDRPARVFAQYLVDRGVGVFSSPGTGWGVVAGPLPVATGGTAYDRWISVIDTGAVIHGRVHNNVGETTKTPTAIVTVRSPTNPDLGWDKCQEIEEVARPVGTGGGAYQPTVTVGANQYKLMRAHCYITTVPIGIEEQSKRQLYTINFRLDIREVP